MTDADRFEAFVREYQDMVFATAVRLLANPTEAEDIAQTVFLRAFEHFSSIGTSATAAGSLKTVTTNLCLNHLAPVSRHGGNFSARWNQQRAVRNHPGGSFERCGGGGVTAGSAGAGGHRGFPIISACHSCSFISKT